MQYFFLLRIRRLAQRIGPFPGEIRTILRQPQADSSLRGAEELHHTRNEILHLMRLMHFRIQNLCLGLIKPVFDSQQTDGFQQIINFAQSKVTE
ncbi:hypothetical protein NQ317_013156 [Molorchus minor]|uniref:Uncharacterized protein n=1 Tax=Molorchus minor TaxID=1323400 RepID=A0ABQ9JX81_9CUCU|nr:hypothetical protein NQ317_013156 [Molorchus minor]